MTPRAVLSLPTYSKLKWAGRTLMRAIFISATLAAAAIGAPLTAEAIAKHYNLNIPRQNLDAALKDFAQQTGLQIARLVENDAPETPVGPITGDLSAEDALKALLAPRGLTYQVINERTIAVVDAAKQSGHSPGADSSIAGRAGRRESIDEPGTSSGGKPVSALEEIVVTAQKRAERLQDVPVPVTAIDADSLVSKNQVRLQDYYTTIPGLSVTTGSFHALQLTIRGLTTGGGNPTVGIVIDDVPYGASKGTAFGLEAPDIDPSDLARVEVLRGPQGTLYGAGSMGGLLKFVTVEPSTDALSGHVQASTNGVSSGEQLGYGFRASVNVPVSDTFAVRASGFTRLDPGYIDDPALGIHGLNKANVSGGRLSSLWRPSDRFSVKLSGLFQHSNLDGSPEVDRLAGLGDLQQSAVRGSGEYTKTIQAYSGTIEAKLGTAALTALTGYNVSRFSDVVDFSAAFPPASVILERNETDKFSEEIRLSVPLGERFEWLLGAFYTHENVDPVEQDLFAANRATGALGTEIVHTNAPQTFSEYAAFTDLTVQVSDRFDVQLGARESENKQSYQSVNLLAPTAAAPQVHTKDNAFTYLVTPRFKVSPDLMIYARLASGYRPGGPNTSVATFGLPSQLYGSDKTQNYEIGLKGAALDRTLSFDASLFRIDWQDIQVQVRQSGFSFYTNGSRAKSQGAELSVESRPLTGLALAGWVAWNDASLTEAFSPTATVYGAEGDRLPFSSRFSGNFSVDQEIPLSGSLSGFVGASVSYVGERVSTFRGLSAGVPLPRQTFPAYAKTDARAGLRYEEWTADLFVNNLTDRRGVLQGGLGATNPIGFYYIQPRTVGLSLARTF